jgi:Icc-related predicted phosphoesterase
MIPKLGMRVHIISDLHLEFAPFSPSNVEADVVVCAGDLHTGRNGLRWIRENFPGVPIIYVLGNHEFYGQKIPKVTAEVKREAQETNVKVLENDRVMINGVSFLGSTLWSDFELNGDYAQAEMDAMAQMVDFRRIRTLPSFRRFRPADARRIFSSSFKWLSQQAQDLAGNPFVIVTHHAPSSCSIPEAFKSDPLSPAYASNLDSFVDGCGAGAWIHGHVHKHVDYTIGKTRVVANPRGYPDERMTGFDPNFVITI